MGLLFLMKQLNAQNYLVTKNNDTIFIQGILDVKHKNFARWTAVTANGTTYKLREIKCIQLGDNYYCNIQDRKLWKRVVEGKINVYALNDKDTIQDRYGNLQKSLMIQKGSEGSIKPYNNTNLYNMIKGDDSLENYVHKKMVAGRSGKGLMVAGIVTIGVSAFSLVVEGLLALFESDENMGTYAIISTTGLGIGIGGMVSGIVINKKSKKVSLDPIYYFNSK